MYQKKIKLKTRKRIRRFRGKSREDRKQKAEATSKRINSDSFDLYHFYLVIKSVSIIGMGIISLNLISISSSFAATSDISENRRVTQTTNSTFNKNSSDEIEGFINDIRYFVRGDFFGNIKQLVKDSIGSVDIPDLGQVVNEIMKGSLTEDGITSNKLENNLPNSYAIRQDLANQSERLGAIEVALLLEAILLYYRAKAFNKASTAVVDAIDIACMRQEITLLSQLDRKPEEINALINLGATYENLELYANVLDISEEAIKRAEAHNLNTLTAISYYNRGNCLTKMEMWQDAENDYQRALVLVENVKDTVQREAILHNFGEMYRRWGKLENSVNLLQLSLESVRQRNDVDSEITNLNNLGLAYRSLSQTQEALDCFNTALNLTHQYYRKCDESRICISLGNLYLLNNQPEQAKYHYHNALVAARQIEDTDWEEGSILSLAAACKELGKFDDIADDFQAVAERACNLGHHENCIKFLTFAGKINLEEKKPDSSADMFDKALSIAVVLVYERLRQCGEQANISFLSQELAEVLDSIGDSIEKSVENNAVEYAVIMYQSLLDKLHSEHYWEESNFWIFDCLKPMGEWLNNWSLD